MTKRILLVCLLILDVSWAYSNNKISFDDFIVYTKKNWVLPERVKRICARQNVIIKVYSDSHNTITKIDVLNNVDKAIPPSLAFLKGYHFNQGLATKNKSIIFCISIESFKTFDCDSVPPKGIKYPRALKALKAYQTQAGVNQRNSIFINKEIVYAVYDTVN